MKHNWKKYLAVAALALAALSGLDTVSAAGADHPRERGGYVHVADGDIGDGTSPTKKG